jgi:vesicle-fusing ATPase
MDQQINKPFQTDNILRHLRASASLDGVCDLPANIRRSLSYIIIDSRVQALTDKSAEQSFSKSSRRQGVLVLLADVSSAGKTLAAQFLAGHLAMDIYRISLGGLVNKHIGKTEKNLVKLFEKAEANDHILFFDEADALFDKRTEVIDGHDRYAKLEVSYLLERMEKHRGIVIFSSNNRNNLDPAHLRRFQYILDFESRRKTKSSPTTKIKL